MTSDLGGRIITVLFADIAPGSAADFAAVDGDARTREVMGGRSVAFGDPREALAAGIELQQGSASAGLPGLRVGVHAGRARPHALTVARGLCSHAAPGQIVVSTVVCGLAGIGGGFAFSYLGPLGVSPLARPVSALLLEWAPDPAASGLWMDRDAYG